MATMPTAKPNNLAVGRFTPAIIPELARIHLEAFTGYMNARLGPGYARALLAWFAAQQGAIALAAMDATDPVGYVVGAPLGYTRAMNRDLMASAIIGAALHPGLILDSRFVGVALGRLKLLAGLAKPNAEAPVLPEPTISLVGIGVATRARGKGAGMALMNGFEAEAARMQMRSMRLSVYPENDVARKLYAAAGWKAGQTPAREKTVMFYSKVIS